MKNVELVTVAEAAILKGVSRSAIYKAIAQQRLNSRRVLGKVAILKRDLEAWVPNESRGRRKGTPMSEEAKQRIGDSQRKRWAKAGRNIS